MIIKFSPQNRDDLVEFIKINNNISINGELLDLDSIPNGATVPTDATNSEFIQIIEKDDIGYITITLLWPYKEVTDINSYPADLIDPDNGILEPIASVV